jgi:hypothetical protein
MFLCDRIFKLLGVRVDYNKIRGFKLSDYIVKDCLVEFSILIFVGEYLRKRNSVHIAAQLSNIVNVRTFLFKSK